MIIEKLKKEYTNAELGAMLGITGQAFGQRTKKGIGQMQVWELAIIADKTGLTNDEILSAFGRRERRADEALVDEIRRIYAANHQ